MEDYMTESPRQKITSSAVVIVLILVVMDGGMVAAVKLGLTDVPPLRYGAVRASILIVCLLPWMVLHAPWRVIAEHFAMIWPGSLLSTATAAGFRPGLGGGHICGESHDNSQPSADDGGDRGTPVAKRGPHNANRNDRNELSRLQA
ncbi:MAG: hypothetical protein QGH20_02580 [Candidatus Latescibacteria bacterium]|nr:hypothetical protein [Candidatus Latescibacterota bacterium]